MDLANHHPDYRPAAGDDPGRLRAATHQWLLGYNRLFNIDGRNSSAKITADR